MKSAKADLQLASTKSSGKEWDHWMDWDPASPSDHVPVTAMRLSAHGDDANGDDAQLSSVKPGEPQSLTPMATEDAAFYHTSKKRKVSVESARSVARTSSKDGRSSSAPNKSHSIVEKRYRTNLNDKIADLRRSVPCFRGDTPHTAENEKLSAAPKHNKSTILTKAIEYIHQLEQRNAYLENVTASLRNQARSSKSEPVFGGVTTGPESYKSESTASGISPSPIQDSPIISNAPQGMIPVPDDIRQLRTNALQEHYADSISSEDDESGAHFSVRGGKLIGKLMLGSLAGLMLIDGCLRNRNGQENDRGLFALPFLASLPTMLPPWPSYGRSESFTYACLLLPIIKSFLVFSVLGLFLFLYLFNSKPKLRLKRSTETRVGPCSLVSPIEVRENAWLTAVQTLKVPRHSWFPEMIALILETGAYVIRQLLGWNIYSWLMGRSEDEEIARVRAWEIAIDAQLTGGDAEVSRSRLVLTVWAAGTLPKTPARLMLKALHIRIMFWQASRWTRICRVLNLAASRLAQYQWTLAKRQLNTVDVATGSANFEPLSDHLLALLQRPIEDVMTDLTIQRAHNLCWDRSASTTPEATGIDDNTEDTAMRGPLDSLALWSSSLTLQEALSNFLDSGESCQAQLSQIEIALRTAPPGSSSSIRALAAKTIFCKIDRTQNINKLIVTLSSACGVFPGSVLEGSPLSSSACSDVLTSLEFAKNFDTVASPQSDLASLENAVRLLDRTCSRVRSLDILALAAAYNLFLTLIKDSGIGRQSLCSLDEIIGDTIDELEKPDLKPRTRAQKLFKTGLRALQVQRRSSSTSLESGYGSM